MNPWLFTFIVSLIFFIILTDYKQLKINIWGGIIPAIFQTAQNILANDLGLWTHKGVGDGMPDWIIFSDRINIFLIGIAFSIGVIFFQHIPKNLYLQVAHIIIFAILWGLFKVLTRKYGMTTNLNWNQMLTAHGFIIMSTSMLWLKTEYFRSYINNEGNTIPNNHK